MALTQKQRSALFDHFAPLVGEETAEAFMAEFPTHEGDEFVTTTFLRAEMAELRSEFAGLRSEFADLRVDFAGLRSEFAGLRSDVTLRLTGVIAVATGIVVAFG